ncbi:hypothetical protein [Mesobacillus thioparans]|uniref:hypothetical protein n=1 Tax=Mesobacillus thioparans TaxID=370439 RepID=UPI0039EF63D5
MSLVILLFIILLLMISFGSFSNKFLGSRFINGRGVTKVFTGYVTALLCASIFSFMVPKGEIFPAEYLTDEEIQVNERLNNDIYSIIESGNIEEAEGLTKKASWAFPLDGKNLSVKAMTSDAMVFIEKAESHGSEIEVTHFSTYSYIDNINITDRITSPDIKLTETTLEISPSVPVNVELVKFTNAFPFNQFSEYGEQFNGGYGMMQGLNFIYIKVPADIEVSGEGYVINE